MRLRLYCVRENSRMGIFLFLIDIISNWAGLAVLFSKQLLYGSQDFFVLLIQFSSILMNIKPLKPMLVHFCHLIITLQELCTIMLYYFVMWRPLPHEYYCHKCQGIFFLLPSSSRFILFLPTVWPFLINETFIILTITFIYKIWHSKLVLIF